MVKSKKLAKKKSPARKRAAQKNAAAPQAAAMPTSFPCNVLVRKGAESIPVQVTDAAHLSRLQNEFGEKHVEVQS